MQRADWFATSCRRYAAFPTVMFDPERLTSRVAPKTYLPNYREYYELRYFAPADFALTDRLDLLGQ